MQQLYKPQSRISAALKHFIEYVGRINTDETKTYSPSVILQSQVQLTNGQWVVMLILDIYPFPEWIAETLKPLLLFSIIFILFSIIIVLGITSPLNELAKKADKLGIGEKIDEIKLRGPMDVQNVIVAFNNMLKRITNVNDHRARALAAISHDIRTPLTSMRLQAEFIEEKDIQEDIFKKIDEMEQICEATITFALQDSWAEKTRVFDIVSLTDSLCSDLAEQGLNVYFELSNKIKFSGRPIALKRAITNLIKNGVEYGNSAHVSIVNKQDVIEIHILDNGSGIPADKMEDLFAPFERLESSRNRDSGGLGLGMAIARSVVRSHGGEIELVNIEGRGLDAVIVLPLTPA
jgi:signal transduction histidine kinase